MFASHQIWTLDVLLQSFARKEIALAPRPGHAHPASVIELIEAVRSHVPIGQLILADNGPGRYTVVDGRERLWAIAHTLRPDVFGDEAEHMWPVILTPPDLPGGGTLAWDDGNHPATGDPAAFPLAHTFRTMKFMGWEADLRNRTDDEHRIKTALDGAHQLTTVIREAKIHVCILRPDIDGEVTQEAIDRIRERANRPFNPTAS